MGVANNGRKAGAEGIALKVVISSGHGKYIRGAAGPSPWGLDEVNEARKVVEQTATVLRGMGVTVTTFHDDISDDQDENLNRIVDFHNDQGTHDLDISVHFNSADFSGSDQTSDPVGVEVFYQSNAGKEYATKTVNAIAAASGLKNRGPKTGNLFFLSHTNQTANLEEICFVNSRADVDIYHAKFNAICNALAESISGKKVQPGAPETKPPTTPKPPTPPAGAGHQMVKKGDTGPEVVTLQKALGCLVADGNFGPTTHTWVKAFQAACDLDADGIVGDDTWDEIDDLSERVKTGKPRLPKSVAHQIYTMAATSEIADYPWPDRGIAPTGYIAGISLAFAYAVHQGDDDDAVNVMSQAQGNAEKDALAWYNAEFAKLNMSNKTAGVDTLRHLFVMQMGLGMRESSGRYCEGRDLSADNVESDTCEAGLFQTSWNIRSGSPIIEPLIFDFWDNPRGFLQQFKVGITATENNLNSYGTGDGVRYQFLSRFAPLFTVMVTGVGMRVLRQHWGPINRREVTIKKEADDLLKDVQELVSAIA